VTAKLVSEGWDIVSKCRDYCVFVLYILYGVLMVD